MENQMTTIEIAPETTTKFQAIKDKIAMKFQKSKAVIKNTPKVVDGLSTITLGGLALDKPAKMMVGAGLVTTTVATVALTGVAAKLSCAIGMGAIFMGFRRGLKAGMRHCAMQKSTV